MIFLLLNKLCFNFVFYLSNINMESVEQFNES